MPESEKGKGVMSFASDLPQIEDPLIENLWTRLLPNYQKKKGVGNIDRSPTNPPTIEEIKGMEDLPPLSPNEIDFDPVNVNQVLIKRSVFIRRRS